MPLQGDNLSYSIIHHEYEVQFGWVDGKLNLNLKTDHIIFNLTWLLTQT